jgi:hypothetical protein
MTGCSNDARADAADKAAFDVAVSVGGLQQAKPSTHPPPPPAGPSQAMPESPVKRRRGPGVAQPSAFGAASSAVWLVTLEQRVSASVGVEWRAVGCFSSKSGALAAARDVIGDSTAATGYAAVLDSEHDGGGTAFSAEGTAGGYTKLVLAKLELDQLAANLAGYVRHS